MLQYCFCFGVFFLPQCSGIFAPWPEKEPTASALEGKVPATGPPVKSLHDPLCFFEIELISGEGLGNPLQYSCLENPMDRGA